MSRAFVLGLTGPSGSGKSEVAAVFSQNGYKVIDADKMAQKVVQKGSKTLLKLAQRFGDDIICADGTLDRRLLAQRAFCSQENTQALNAITHPAIVELVKEQINLFSKNGHNKIIYDAPLLFESKSDALCDCVLVVVADTATRIERIKQRDSISEKEIEQRIKAQYDDSFYTEKADYVINNSSTFDELMKKTYAVITAIDEVYNGTL